MGEISKRTGELGEETGFRFLERIGWVNGQRNLSVPCNDTTNHPSRKTHGVDYLKAYNCPLIQERIVHAVVSIKATKSSYAQYPNSYFKTFVREVSDICSCYNRSDAKYEIMEEFSGDPIDIESVVGVLLWFSNDAGEEKRDLLKETATANIEGLEDLQFEAAYVVDLKRAEFIWEVLQHADLNFTGWEFLYIETGLNYREDIKVKSGSLLPVEYINSSIIPLKHSMAGSENLVLYSIDPYNEEDLKKLVGLANKLSGAFAGKINILFPDYVTNGNENNVKRILEYFRDNNLAEKISVQSYQNKLIK